MTTITVDAALYGLNGSLTGKQQQQLEGFLSNKWRWDVKIGSMTTVAFDLVGTKDGDRDYEINKGHISTVLSTHSVVILGSRSLPLHALKSFVDAVKGLDVRAVPVEVFTVVEDHNGEFQRFSHLNLYKRES